MTTTAVRRTLDPGKVRRFQHILTDDGFVHALAIDHLDDFAELLGDDVSSVAFADVVAAKDKVIRSASSEVSAVLVDPLYGIGHLIPTGSIGRSIGLVTSIEDEDYSIPDGPHRVKLREGWDLHKIGMAGVDFAKLLWFYRPDTDTAVHQAALVADLVKQSEETSVPIIVEPIWYPLPGEDPASPEWRERRVRGVIESAVLADELGADLLKLEFPGYVQSADYRARAVDAVAELDSKVTSPWIILSAGVGYDDFAVQLELASRGGACGYMAGRSIWRDVAKTFGDGTDSASAETTVKQRLSRLNAITREFGRPHVPVSPLTDTLEHVRQDWYLSWH